jgi:hypothetical protein
MSKAGCFSISLWVRQAADDNYFKRLKNNFLQKLNFAAKTQRHKGKMRSIFYFVPLWQTSFHSEAEKKNILVICKELKFFYECLTLTP